MGKRLDIAIAGAGIGGLTAATLLARAGHSVRVFDQFDAPKPIGSGLMLQKTGLAVLGQLGLREDIDALGSRVERLWGLVSQTDDPFWMSATRHSLLSFTASASSAAPCSTRYWKRRKQQVLRLSHQQ